MQVLLIVDDNRPLMEDLAEILADEGFRVRAFESPLEVLRNLAHLYFDAALIDVRMPEMDGVALQAQLARARPAARYVLMTAYSDEERVEQAHEQGVAQVLAKPVTIEALVAALSGGQGRAS